MKIARARTIGALAATGALVLFAYAPVADNGFVSFDDPAYITANPPVAGGFSIAGLRWALSTFHMGNWHPLTWISHMLDVSLFGLRPAGHHATSLLFHAANTLLLFGALRSMTGCLWRSAFVAAVFGVHPLHVESVAWAAERKDVLSTFLGLLALLAWLKHVRRPHPAWRFGAPILFALSLMAKPMTITLPFVMLLLDWWPLGRWSPARNRGMPLQSLLLEKAGLFLLAAGSAVVSYVAQSRAEAVVSGPALSLPARTANALVAYCSYLAQTLWPRGLAAFYPHPGATQGWEVWASASAALAVLTSLALLLHRRVPCLATGWLWFLGMLVPVIGLVQVGGQAMADRYAYLPLAGVLIAGAWGLADAARKLPQLRMPLAAAALMCPLAFAGATRQQVATWRDDFSLFGHMLEVTESNWLAHVNYGNALAWAGRQSEAMAHYRETLRLLPDYPMAENNVALELERAGSFDEAVSLFKKILSAHPDLDYVNCNLGRALADTGRYQEAEQYYRRALESNPRSAVAMNNLGALYAAQGRNEEAAASYRKALEVDPRYGDAHFNLGLALVKLDKPAEAIEHLRMAVRINPRQVSGFVVLGRVLAGAGRSAEAADACERALALDPQRSDVRQLLEGLRRETARRGR